MEAVETAIEQSVRETRIVTLNPDARSYPDVALELDAQCDDYVEARGVLEFWGLDDAGQEWRVHVVKP